MLSCQTDEPQWELESKHFLSLKIFDTEKLPIDKINHFSFSIIVFQPLNVKVLFYQCQN